MEGCRVKLPSIRILFALYTADGDVAISRVVKACGVNKASYVDELRSLGLVEVYHRVSSDGRVSVRVAISKEGADFMTRVLDLVTKHGLWGYVDALVRDGLLVLDGKSTRLIHALSQFVQ